MKKKEKMKILTELISFENYFLNGIEILSESELAEIEREIIKRFVDYLKLVIELDRSDKKDVSNY